MSTTATGRGEERLSSSHWVQRLDKYRQGFVYGWDVLTLAPDVGVAPGLCLWLLVHGAVVLMSYFSGSLLHVVGNFLLLTSLVYILVYSFCSSQLTHGSWTDDQEQKFICVCNHLLFAEKQMKRVWTQVKLSRQLCPVKFYGLGLALTVLVSQVGWWLSTPIIVHLLVSACLLTPLGIVYQQRHPLAVEDLWMSVTDIAHRASEAVTKALQEVTVSKEHRN